MNDLTKVLYFIDLIQNFNSLLVVIIWMSGAASAASLAIYSTGDLGTNEAKKFTKYIKSFSALFLIFLLIKTAIPSKQTMYLMLSSEVADKMIQSQDFKKLYTKSYELLNKKIDEALADGNKK